MASKIPSNFKIKKWYVAMIVLTILVVVVPPKLQNHYTKVQAKKARRERRKAEKAKTALKKAENAGIITTKETADGISYYYCEGSGPAYRGQEKLDEAPTLILLHGAKFTKEDWKSPPGILQDFCQRETEKKMNILAFDLPVSADYKDLMKLIDSLSIPKPVSLLTPSASGKTMTSWLLAGNDMLRIIPKYVRYWIPVASLSVNNVPQDSVRKMTIVKTHILSIHGDRDTAGKNSSERLQNYAGADVVELQGGHSCYLDQPKEFVTEVIKFLETPIAYG